MVLSWPAAFWGAGLLCLAMSLAVRWVLRYEASRGIRLWCGAGAVFGASLALWGVGLTVPSVDIQVGALVLGLGALVVQALAVRFELNRPVKAMQGLLAWWSLSLLAAISRPFLENDVLCFTAVWIGALGHLGFMGVLTTKLSRRVVQLARQQAHQAQAVRLSEQMAQLDMRHGLSGIAASVAHELSQPLTNLYLITDRLELELKDKGDDLLQQCVQDLQRNTQKAGDLLGRIRSFVQSKNSLFQRVALEQVIASATSCIRDRGLTEGVQIQVSLPPQSLFVRGDAIELTHILMNVLRNAVQATEGQAVRHVDIRLWREGQTVHVSFTDNGPGMTGEVLAQAGTVFFSTKPTGMGVGLTIAKSLIKRHGGRLVMGNHPAGGACVELQLPVLA